MEKTHRNILKRRKELLVLKDRKKDKNLGNIQRGNFKVGIEILFEKVFFTLCMSSQPCRELPFSAGIKNDGKKQEQKRKEKND